MELHPLHKNFVIFYNFSYRYKQKGTQNYIVNQFVNINSYPYRKIIETFLELKTKKRRTF